MKQYTYSEARRTLSKVLDEAEQYGTVQVIRRNGKTFEIKPILNSASPLDVPGITPTTNSMTSINREEIVSIIRESRADCKLDAN